VLHRDVCGEARKDSTNVLDRPLLLWLEELSLYERKSDRANAANRETDPDFIIIIMLRAVVVSVSVLEPNLWIPWLFCQFVSRPLPQTMSRVQLC